MRTDSKGRASLFGAYIIASSSTTGFVSRRTQSDDISPLGSHYEMMMTGATRNAAKIATSSDVLDVSMIVVLLD